MCLHITTIFPQLTKIDALWDSRFYNKRYFKFEENLILPYHFTHESDICKEHKMQIYIYWRAYLFACNKLCMDRESSDVLCEIRLLSIYIVAKSIASINHGQLIMQIKFMVCSRVPINAIIRLKFDDHYDIARQNVFKVDNSCLDIYSSRLVIMIQLIISF